MIEVRLILTLDNLNQLKGITDIGTTVNNTFIAIGIESVF